MASRCRGRGGVNPVREGVFGAGPPRRARALRALAWPKVPAGHAPGGLPSKSYASGVKAGSRRKPGFPGRPLPSSFFQVAPLQSRGEAEHISVLRRRKSLLQAAKRGVGLGLCAQRSAGWHRTDIPTQAHTHHVHRASSNIYSIICGGFNHAGNPLTFSAGFWF